MYFSANKKANSVTGVFIMSLHRKIHFAIKPERSLIFLKLSALSKVCPGKIRLLSAVLEGELMA